MSLAKKLQHCEILAPFDDALLAQLASCGTIQRHQPNEEIFSQGNPAEALYVISKGAVRLQRDTQLGPFTLATMNRGDLFGDRFLLEPAERNLTALAETRAELVALIAAAHQCARALLPHCLPVFQCDQGGRV
ncbi:MAG: cyclic nucleotide-binding domain-containing protein, partial [Nitrospirae bacterium]|nr:cyclic nucleotide-binding domain-containing protein [Nitrospirota bacterium]